MRTATSVLILILTINCHASAQVSLGDRVFLKAGAKPTLDGEPIDAKLIPMPAIIAEIDGEVAFVERGWVGVSDLLTTEQAMDYFTEKIHKKASAELYIARSAVWREKEGLENAISDAEAALRLDPQNAEAFRSRGNAALDNDNLDAAIDDFTRAISLDPKFVKAYLSRAEAWIRKDDFARAVKDYSEAIRLDKFPAHFNNRAIAQRMQGDFDSAIQDHDRAIELDASYPFAYYNRALCWKEKKDERKAIDDFTEAIRLDTKFGLAFIERGLLLSTKTDTLDAALDDFTKAIDSDPTIPRPHVGRGLVFARKGQYENAIASYSEALQVDPQYWAAYYNRANTKDNSGDFEGALKDYADALRYAPDDGKRATVLKERAIAYSAKSKLDEALADVSQALVLAPALSSALTIRAEIYIKTDDFEAADADCAEAIRLNPSDARAHYLRGHIYIVAGERDLARRKSEHLTRKLAASKRGSELNETEPYLVSSDAVESAMNELSESIRIDPKFSGAYFKRAFVLAKHKGDLKSAIKDYEAANSSGGQIDEKQFVDLCLLAADGCAGQGNLSARLDALGEAIRRDPNCTEAYYQRAWVSLAAQRRKKYSNPKQAIEDATRAVELTDWKGKWKIETLSDAYLANGDTASAIRITEKLISLFPNDVGNFSWKSNLEAYRDGNRWPYDE